MTNKLGGKSISKKICFVVCPIGKDLSEERRHSDWVYNGILEPLFEREFSNYELIRGDKINAPGQIDVQVIENLLNSDLVIADLTNLNPNVLYEIGIRHMACKPIIHIHLNGQVIPFDISLFRSVGFSIAFPKDITMAQQHLKSFIEATQSESYRVDNPVVSAMGKIEFEKTASDRDRYIDDQISALSSRLSKIESIREGRSVGIVGCSPQYFYGHGDHGHGEYSDIDVSVGISGKLDTNILENVMTSTGVPDYFFSIIKISKNTYTIRCAGSLGIEYKERIIRALSSSGFDVSCR